MEAKSNEYHRAIEAKEKSYKVMLDIARKPSGGRGLEWFKEVLARGPQQDVSYDESEAILWKAVEEYCVKRRREQGSPEVGLREQRSTEVGMREQRSTEVGMREQGSTEVGMREQRSTEVGMREQGSTEVAFREASEGKVIAILRSYSKSGYTMQSIQIHIHCIMYNYMGETEAVITMKRVFHSSHVNVSLVFVCCMLHFKQLELIVNVSWNMTVGTDPMPFVL